MLTIAEAVSLELGSATAVLEVVDTLITFLDVCAVLAFAFLAEFVIFGTATVATIPIATGIVAEKTTPSNCEANGQHVQLPVALKMWLTRMLQVGS